jgi:hypothetical protein
MCVVSMVSQHYTDKWQDTLYPDHPWWIVPTVTQPEISKDEFDALKRDVEELKALLKRAKKYDEDTGQPDCETADKVALLRKVAQLVGVDLGDVLGAP